LFILGKTPKYSYTVNVGFPQVIQLQHPDPILLKIHITPDLDPQKTTICPDNDNSSLPPVYISSVKLKLKADFRIRTKRTFLEQMGTVKNHTFRFSFPAKIEPVVIPVIHGTGLNHVTSTPDAFDALPETQSFLSHAARRVLPNTPVSPQRASPLNLGAHLSILLGCSRASTCSKPAVSFRREVYPTFATYNIVLKYRLQ